MGGGPETEVGECPCSLSPVSAPSSPLRSNMSVLQLNDKRKTPLRETPPNSSQKVLTDTDWGVSGPLVVLQAYPDGSPYEPEAGVALINHCVPVTEAIAADVAIHNGVWGATVAGWKMNKTNKNTLENMPSVKAPHLWTSNRVLLFSTGSYMEQSGIHQNGGERETDYVSCVTESLCCREETNTMSVDYISIKSYRSNTFLICLYCQVTNSLEYKHDIHIYV